MSVNFFSFQTLITYLRICCIYRILTTMACFSSRQLIGKFFGITYYTILYSVRSKRGSTKVVFSPSILEPQIDFHGELIGAIFTYEGQMLPKLGSFTCGDGGGIVLSSEYSFSFWLRTLGCVISKRAFLKGQSVRILI